MWGSLISETVLPRCKIGTPQWSFLLLLIEDHNAFVFLVTFGSTNLLTYILSDCDTVFVFLFLFFGILLRIEWMNWILRLLLVTCEAFNMTIYPWSLSICICCFGWDFIQT